MTTENILENEDRSTERNGITKYSNMNVAAMLFGLTGDTNRLQKDPDKHAACTNKCHFD